MSLQTLQTRPHPAGNRIDLQWQLDPEVAVDGVRIVRRQGRYPQHPEDGVIVADVAGVNQLEDTNLPAERQFYYALFPFSGAPPVYAYDTDNRVTALATANHGYPEYMFKLLPAIYHRYDKQTQFLSRFLQLVGGQVNQFHSYANFSRNLRRLEKTPGTLLPLLAEWIAWQPDQKRDLNSQRNEIKNAPAIYRRVGLMPTITSTVKRISDWDCRNKEYVHNVFASNRPPRLNLWSRARNGAGVWGENETLQSLDYCFDGRPAFAADNNGVRWLFYHTERKGRWEIWSKATPFVLLDGTLAPLLVAGTIARELWQALRGQGIELNQSANVNVIDSRIWEIADGSDRYVVEQTLGELRVYDNIADDTLFSASRPQVVNERINKYASAAVQGNRLWLVWSSFDTNSARWQVHCRRRESALWSDTGPQSSDTTATNPFIEGGIYDESRQRRRAFISADDSGDLWLFWQEHDGDRWQLRYNHHDGSNWGEALTFPGDGGDDPRVEDDIMVVVSPSAPTPRIYLFWARQESITAADGERWQVAVREKSDQVFDAANWSAIHLLPKDVTDNHHDREAFALFNDAGELEVFWASNREDSGWSVWRSTLQDINTDSWSTAERITEAVYHQRAPIVRPISDGIQILYRSARQLTYSSDVYRASSTRDERYAGSNTVDARHQQLITLRDRFEDPQRYTYDTGVNGERDDSNRIARDTVGAFVETATLDESESSSNVARLRQVLREFMPLTDRVVFVPESNNQTEYVYSYDLPPAMDSVYINSSYSDVWVSTAESSALEPGEDFDSVLET